MDRPPATRFVRYDGCPRFTLAVGTIGSYSAGNCPALPSARAYRTTTLGPVVQLPIILRASPEHASATSCLRLIPSPNEPGLGFWDRCFISNGLIRPVAHNCWTSRNRPREGKRVGALSIGTQAPPTGTDPHHPPSISSLRFGIPQE